jgi:hypothetical protein
MRTVLIQSRYTELCTGLFSASHKACCLENRVKIDLCRLKTKKLNSVAFSPQANYTDLCRLSTKLVPTFADRGCHVVSATDPPAVNSVFLTGAASSRVV